MRMTTELERFLMDRLTGPREVTVGECGWVGVSSNAMVKEALTGQPIDPFDYPLDLADLSRCCATFARAPWDLKKAMLPRLLDYCRHVEERYAPTPDPPTPDPNIAALSSLNWDVRGFYTGSRLARFLDRLTRRRWF